MLEVQGLVKSFGGVVAVDGVSFSLPSGTILGVIGPNGSGKTTLLNLLNGVHRPEAGSVALMGQPVTGLPPSRLAALGIMRTFQNTRVFRTLTVFQNMMVPLLHRPAGPEAWERARQLLGMVGLESLADVAASELSGGQQRLLEFARALMTRPSLLLMDEPFAGVHPDVIQVMCHHMQALRADGISFVVVSHEIPVIMGLSQEVICLDRGRIIARGTPDEVSRDPAVVEAYLGSSARS